MDSQNENQPAESAEPVQSTQSPRSYNRIARLFWQGRFGPAFWTITGTISLVVNIILIVALVSLGKQVFEIKQLLSGQLIGGLYDNFVKMDQASIHTTVQVESQIPVQFDLPVRTNTIVVLTEDTQLSNAMVNLRTGGVSIDAPASIVLPAGTRLPIALDIVVPVDASVPVSLIVPVDIPLSETELHEPFVGLREVLEPYRSLLQEGPNTWEEMLCPPDGSWWCDLALPRESAVP